jgi:hypothetical protein
MSARQGGRRCRPSTVVRGLDPRISRSVSPAEMAGTSPAMTVVGGQEGAVPAGAAATRRYSPYTACALPAKIARRSASLIGHLKT